MASTVILNTKTNKIVNEIQAEKNTLYLMIGLPYSGKSTFVKNFIKGQYELLSRDELVYVVGKSDSYRTAWDSLGDEGQKEIERMYNDNKIQSIKNRDAVIIDKTNMSMKSRNKEIEFFKNNNYKIVYVLFNLTDEELQRRIKLRADKKIPNEVLDQMAKSFQFPRKKEYDDMYMVFYEK